MSSMSNTSSNATTKSGRLQLPDRLYNAFTTLVASEMLFVAVGVSINAWLLASILSSQELRVRIRNQFLCCIAIQNIFDDVFIAIPNIAWYFSILNSKPIVSCPMYMFTKMINVICSITSDFLIVALACVFLAQVLDFKPGSRLKVGQLRVGRVIALTLPWTLAAVAGPLSVWSISYQRRSCSVVNVRKYFILESSFTVFPLCLATAVIAVAVTLRQLRFGHGRLTAQGNMDVQLMGSGPEIDNSSAYIGAILVCAACEVSRLVAYFLIGNQKYTQ